MAILMVFHILNISDILIMRHNYELLWILVIMLDSLGFCMEDVQIDNQPQNKKKYQMYFKKWVIILTLGLYNLNIQNFFECLQTF